MILGNSEDSANPEECVHWWAHCRFVENTKIKFSMAFYCRKCLKLIIREYPPIKEYVKDAK